MLVTVVAALTLVSCAVTQSTPPEASRGAATRDALVDAYLTALASRDTQALTALVDPAVDARADVAALITASGGTLLGNHAVAWRDEFGGIFVVATVTGTNAGSNQPTSLTIPISRKAGRFYLALGSADLRGSDSSISSPSPGAS